MASESAPVRADAAGCEGGALVGLEEDILLPNRPVCVWGVTEGPLRNVAVKTKLEEPGEACRKWRPGKTAAYDHRRHRAATAPAKPGPTTLPGKHNYLATPATTRSRRMQGKQKLILRLAKDAAVSPHSLEDLPLCRRLVDDHVRTGRLNKNAGEDLRHELEMASADVCARVFESFGAHSMGELFGEGPSVASTSIADSNDEDDSEEEEDEPKAVRLKLDNKASRKRNAANPSGQSTVSTNTPGHSPPKSSAGRPGKKTVGATSSTDKPRIPNQVPITTFWNYIEAFFKPIDEGDLKFLDDPTMPVDATPFLIPTLGSRYEQQWRDLYGFIVQAKGAKGLPEERPERIPSLPMRILSMLIDQSVPGLGSEVSSQPDDEQEVSAHSLDHIQLSERISRQLGDLGLHNVPSADYAENDAICTELRACQAALRDQMHVNWWRKRKLAARIRRHMAVQEFYSLLLEIDKQTDAAFQRRLRASRKRKRAADDEDGLVTPSQDTVRLIENRAKLTAAFKDVFPGQLDALLPEPTSIIDRTTEQRILEKADGSWLPLPDIPIGISGATHPTFNQHSK